MTTLEELTAARDTGHYPLIFAGGVVKGAFAAGVLAVLTDPGEGVALSMRRIDGAAGPAIAPLEMTPAAPGAPAVLPTPVTPSGAPMDGAAGCSCMRRH